MFEKQRSQSGFTLAELLIVIALIGITVGIGIPLINEQVRIAEIRSTADRLAVHLRAARMIAVSQHRDVVGVHGDDASVDPNTISYDKTLGDTLLVKMPGRVKIVTGSAASITFHSDGSSDASSTVTAESVVSEATERWVLSVNILGLVSVAHTRV
jgi:prepilin-type N-terminal cleavage/methylation domain-containing protein